LAKVQAIIAKLAIRDRFAEKRQAANAKPPKGGLLTALKSRAIESGWFEVQEEIPEVEELDVDVNWLTEPVLSVNNTEYVRLSQKVSAVERMLVRYGGDKDSTIAALANMKMTQETLEELLEQFSELIYQELEQVKDITADVGKDSSTISDRIDAVRDVTSVYGEVMRAFFPKPTK
jgi:hypothetical protein